MGAFHHVSGLHKVEQLRRRHGVSKPRSLNPGDHLMAFSGAAAIAESKWRVASVIRKRYRLSIDCGINCAKAA